jgi:FkbM family methyltransferase
MGRFFKKLKSSAKKRLATIKKITKRLCLTIFGYVKIDGIKLPFYEITETSRLHLLNGTYEDVERNFVRNYITTSAYVVELGASIGVISCHILQKRPTKLLSFEAVAQWAKIARLTVGLNFKNPPFELVEMAIAPVGQSGVAFKYDAQENLGGLVVPVSDSGSITVPALSLYDVNSNYGVPPNAWLVMDIEGMEWDIAKYQSDALRRYEGVIVECHKTTDGQISITPARIVDEIILCGFKLVEKADHGTHIVAVFKRTAK